MHRSQYLSSKSRKMRCSCGFHTVHAMVAKISFNRQVVLNLEPAQATHDAHDDPICSEDMLLARARQLYEDAWSQGRVLLLNTIMAEDHAQVDRVWQPTPGVGRRRMKRGILAYRAAYPDIKFTVEDAAVVPGSQKVFVYWSASGTNTGYIREQPPTGKRVEFCGISLLEFDAGGQIRRSVVFRQAPEDEKQYFLSLDLSRGIQDSSE